MVNMLLVSKRVTGSDALLMLSYTPLLLLNSGSRTVHGVFEWIATRLNMGATAGKTIVQEDTRCDHLGTTTPSLDEFSLKRSSGFKLPLILLALFTFESSPSTPSFATAPANLMHRRQTHKEASGAFVTRSDSGPAPDG